MHGKKTEEAAMALENQEAANMEQLKDLVRQETEKKYKSLEQKYNTLLQKVEDNLQKNVTSRDQSGASGKKKYNNTQQKGQEKSNHPMNPHPTSTTNGKKNRNRSPNQKKLQNKNHRLYQLLLNVIYRHFIQENMVMIKIKLMKNLVE